VGVEFFDLIGYIEKWEKYQRGAKTPSLSNKEISIGLNSNNDNPGSRLSIGEGLDRME